MLIRLFFFFASLSSAIEEKLWKWWYQKLSASYKKMDWRFINYGYAPTNETSTLTLKDEVDQENRLFIQLYQHTLLGVDLKGKEVLEVGSGRGGGADYVARYFAPSSIVGVDFAKNAVELCNQFYNISNLDFVEGNAEKLPFENNRFDVIFNIESSHCYGNMKAFITEVTRVLKPGGIFAWADLRTQKIMEKEDAIFRNSSLELLSKEDITPNILKALDQISNRKKEAIQKRVSYFWQSLFFEFTGVRDSKIYKSFQEGKMVYWCYRFQKPNQ
jgi:ubiquinone/menaquinone biosynthesis C-methylase UbiE